MFSGDKIAPYQEPISVSFNKIEDLPDIKVRNFSSHELIFSYINAIILGNETKQKFFDNVITNMLKKDLFCIDSNIQNFVLLFN